MEADLSMPHWVWWLVAVLVILAVVILWVEHITVHVH